MAQLLWPVADDQVDFGQAAVFIGLVVVDQGAARGFDDANALAAVVLAGVEDVGAEDVRVVAQDAHALDGEEGLRSGGRSGNRGCFRPVCRG